MVVDDERAANDVARPSFVYRGAGQTWFGRVVRACIRHRLRLVLMDMHVREGEMMITLFLVMSCGLWIFMYVIIACRHISTRLVLLMDEGITVLA